MRELARMRQLFVLEPIQYCASRRFLSRHAHVPVPLFLSTLSVLRYVLILFVCTATSDVRGA